MRVRRRLQSRAALLQHSPEHGDRRGGGGVVGRLPQMRCQGQDGRALQHQGGHAASSEEPQPAERLNHQGAAGVLLSVQPQKQMSKEKEKEGASQRKGGGAAAAHRVRGG